MTDKLLPCPFCGGEPLEFRVPGYSQLWRIECKNCDAGPSSSLRLEDAQTVWNTRFDPTPAPATRSPSVLPAVQHANIAQPKGEQSKIGDHVSTCENTPTPAPTMACPCTTFERDENCPVGFPSLLCAACEGKGIAPVETIVALAAEMLKVAEQVDELEDPFAAWESVSLVRSQNDQLRKALKPFAEAPYVGSNAFNRAALSDQDFRGARAAFFATTTEGE